MLHAAEIGVTAKDDGKSLTGEVNSFIKKLEVENATKKTHVVKAVIENIEVKFPNNWMKTDSEIAKEVLLILNTNYYVPKDKISIIVENGWVTLEGKLPWNY